MKPTGLNRREVLQRGALATLGLLCAPGQQAFAALAGAPNAQTEMLRRPIPGQTERLPVIGIGLNFFGGIVPDDLLVRREILRRMSVLERPIIDTAQAYGRTEELLGQMIAELGIRDQLFLSTKMPLGGDATTGDAAIETSLRALRVQHIDLMMVHNLYRFDDYLAALNRAKDARRVRYIGATASVQQLSELKRRLAENRLDFIQVGYSLANRRALPLIEFAHEQGVAVIVGEAFGGRRAAENVFAMVKGVPLPDWAADIDAGSWAQVLLKYALSAPGVVAVTPGTDSLAHLDDNLKAGRGRMPDAALRREIENHWQFLRSKKAPVRAT